MAGSKKDKQQNNRPQNDVIDSAKAFFTSFGVLFLVFLIALVASLVIPKEQEMAEDTPAAEINAETVYQEAGCMGCHGQNLEGTSAPPLTAVGSKYDEQQIAEIIKNGKPPAMPGGLVSKPAEVEALAKWLAEKK
ncbi:YqzM family protein [Brevibacillus humidisoli]|uniref:YqzM family protein n=1 Tax=Brevibacillus humidisoli TaxID=2895522 RepID=UPI001E385EC2|nr:YqzM family protein [Brevibacillus humidisoli]UFJ39946.1 YqzM family protein [Brevibacillus humidisoli]